MNKSEHPVTDAQIRAFWEAVDKIDWGSIVSDLITPIEAAAQAGVDAAADQLSVDAKPVREDANQDAVDYAHNRGAEMVGMRWVGEQLIQNDRLITRPAMMGPGPTWAISDTTREKLTALVETAKAEGWSATQFQIAIMESDAFSPARALMIARTESAFADSHGNAAIYQRTGVEQKKWVTAHDDIVSPDCLANEAEGVIDFDQPFQSGAMMPPDHPNCRCVLIPVQGEGLTGKCDANLHSKGGGSSTFLKYPSIINGLQTVILKGFNTAQPRDARRMLQ